MAAETEANLSKVDSLVEEPKKRRVSSMAADTHNIADLEKTGETLVLPIETQKTGWKVNTSPMTVEDPSILKLPLVTPKVRKIDLYFDLGLTVTARNLKGVTVKDAMDAIHKQFKKKADDELELPYLAGFEWDREERYGGLKVHLSKVGAPAPSSSKKSKKKAKEEE